MEYHTEDFLQAPLILDQWRTDASIARRVRDSQASLI
jgi:hypothetical protein